MSAFRDLTLGAAAPGRTALTADWVLGHAAGRPALLGPRATPVLIDAAEAEGVVAPADASRLRRSSLRVRVSANWPRKSFWKSSPSWRMRRRSSTTWRCNWPKSPAPPDLGPGPGFADRPPLIRGAPPLESPQAVFAPTGYSQATIV